jgi:hypothetical protein
MIESCKVIQPALPMEHRTQLGNHIGWDSALEFWQDESGTGKMRQGVQGAVIGTLRFIEVGSMVKLWSRDQS